MDDRKTLDRERIREAIKKGLQQPHWIRAAERAQLGSGMIAASVEDLTTDVLSELLEELEPPQETLTWTIGGEMRAKWDQRRVLVSSLDRDSGESLCPQIERILEGAEKSGRDLLVIGLRKGPEGP